MRFYFIHIFTLGFASSVLAELVFEDKFERSESQEKTEEIGNGWSSNSKNRAKGNKQVDLKDGAMFIAIHPEADHSVSVVHDLGIRDGTVSLRFMLEDENDSIALDFADPSYKQVHAGHILRVTIKKHQVTLEDLKTGGANLAFAEKKKAKALTAADRKMISGSKTNFPIDLETSQWHSVSVKIKGEVVSVSLDEKAPVLFTSKGFAHPIKRLLRLSVPRNAAVDDVKITGTN